MVPMPTMENCTVSVPRSLFSRVPNEILLRPSSLGTQLQLSSLKDWIILSSGHDSLPSLLKREARPHAVGVAEKQKQVIWVCHISIWIHMLRLSTTCLVYPWYPVKGEQSLSSTVVPLWWQTHPVLTPQFEDLIGVRLEFHHWQCCRRVRDISWPLFIISNSILLCMDIHCL